MTLDDLISELFSDYRKSVDIIGESGILTQLNNQHAAELNKYAENDFMQSLRPNISGHKKTVRTDNNCRPYRSYC